MSVIGVKGTKTTAPEADASQRYVLKSMDRKSKTPIVLGAFLTGLALYLKSIFPNWASEKEAPPPAEANKEGAAQPPMTQAQLLAPVDHEETTGTVPSAEPSVGSGGRLIEPQPPAKFMLVESPEISDFFGLESPTVWQGVMPSPLLARHANDNVGGGSISTPDGPGSADSGETDPDETDPDETDPEDTGPGVTDSDVTDPGTDPDNTVPGDIDPDDGTGPGETDPDEHQCPVECEGGNGDPCDEDDPQVANRAPRVSGPVYLLDVTGCAILAIGLTDLLRNAYDPDGDMLSVSDLTVSSGTLTQSGEGWIFHAGPQLIGPVTVTYQITDGDLTVDQTAHFSVIRSFIEGTDGDDTILGSMCADDVEGGGGDDNIDARAGDDVIAGGRGDDHIVAADGHDTVFGGHGDDIIFGGKGNDHISGGGGNDRLFGEEGNDVVFGNDGGDRLSGGEGDDLLSGGEGDDVIADGEGEDVVQGEAGNDHVVAALDQVDDAYDGGEGSDTLDYTATKVGVKIDLSEGVATGPETGTDTVFSFEAVIGGSGKDEIIGSSGDDMLYGNGGEDLIEGGSGDDVIDGDAGDDLLLDGKGEDELLGGAGNDKFVAALDEDDDLYDGGEGRDTLDYSATQEGMDIDLSEGVATGAEIGTDSVASFESAIGGSGDDEIIGGSGDDTLFGNAGDDEIEGGARDDLLEGGEGDDILDGGAGDDLLFDGEGEDQVLGGAGNDQLVAALDEDDDIYDGGEGCDTLEYSSTSNGVTVDLANGSASGLEIGEDSISGFETLRGGQGDDHFIASDEAVVFAGGDGENTFEFSAPPETAQPAPVLHEILDFKVGDLIRMSKYDIFEEVLADMEDRFEDIYGDDIDDDDIAIRYRHDWSDEMDRTIIEADFNNDDIYETTINMQGHHVLIIVEQA